MKQRIKRIDFADVKELQIMKEFTDIDKKIQLLSDAIMKLANNGYRAKSIWIQNDGETFFVCSSDLHESDYMRLIARLK